jgi:hypothetical protein
VAARPLEPAVPRQGFPNATMKTRRRLPARKGQAITLLDLALQVSLASTLRTLVLGPIRALVSSWLAGIGLLQAIVAFARSELEHGVAWLFAPLFGYYSGSGTSLQRAARKYGFGGVRRWQAILGEPRAPRGG